jgi:AraC-like DNA-binding protein
MKIADEKTMVDLCVTDIMVISGIRPSGRSTDYRTAGRMRHGFLYVWNGEARFWDEEKRVVIAQSGDLVFIPKMSRYRMEYTAESTTFVVVNFEMADKNGKEITLFDAITVAGRDNDAFRLAKLMTKFEMCSASQGMAAHLRRKELLYRLLSVISNDSPTIFTKQPYHAKIVPGVLLLKQSYLENLSVDDYADACNMSVSSFRQLFRQEYGLSPIQYRMQLRIRRAQELLEEGSCTVTEAAYASGFENIGYFCKCYKRLTGRTPGQAKR